jgi:hypothetical protein
MGCCTGRAVHVMEWLKLGTQASVKLHSVPALKSPELLVQALMHNPCGDVITGTRQLLWHSDNPMRPATSCSSKAL